MDNLKKHIPILEYLKNLNSKEQKNLIKNANVALLRVFSEICLNLMKRNIELSPLDITRLKKHEHLIKKLSQRKHSIKVRKNILQRGGFLSSILSLLPALVGGILSLT